jgi:peptidoglycan/LPS O-acetylase OafA/YrhL
VSSTSQTAPSSTRELRREVQALRALAVLLVLVYHLWPERLPGGYVGVDVFFVISGFLITAHILRDVAQKDFRVLRFWARRVRRLLPASLLVLAVTALGIVATAPQQQWQQWFREVAASAMYFENWLLASDAVDYLAADNAASPVQHYWSLSAEEQFYLIWPLLILLALGARRVLRLGRRTAIFCLLALAVTVTFVVSVVLTGHDPSVAYLATPARAWEFGAGGLLAFAPAPERMPSALRTVASWCGLLLIAATAVFFTPDVPFPGYLALAPVVGTLLVLWAGEASGRLSPRPILTLWPVQLLGDVSYSVYLWHWPLVVLVPYALGRDLTTAWKLAILACSLLLGWLTTRLVERPFQRRTVGLRHRFTFAGAAVVTASVVGFAAIGWSAVQVQVETDLKSAHAVVASGKPCFGAAARSAGAECADREPAPFFVPSVLAAADDLARPQTVRCGWTIREESEADPCRFGERDSDLRIALVGDSHMQQYAGVFERLAYEQGWSVDSFSKGGCPYSDVRRDSDALLSAACTEWLSNVEGELLAGNYDLVVTSQVSGVRWAPPPGTSVEDFAEEGLVRAWQSLSDAGLPIAVLRDSPRPVAGLAECLSHADSPEECDNPRSAALPYDPQPAAVERMSSDEVVLIDFTDLYCGPERCSPVIGGVLVHRDQNHITNTWSMTLADELRKRIEPMLDR